MHKPGHYGAALVLYAPVGFAVAVFGALELAVAGGLLTVALATIPDLDLRVPFLDHRGPTHSIVFTLLVGTALAAGAASLVGTEGGASLAVIGFAFFVGTLSIASHLLADVVTPMGVAPFWPVSSRRYSLDLVYSANALANYVLFVAGLVAAGLAAYGVTAVN